MKTNPKELQEICDLIKFSKVNRSIKRYLNFGLLPEDFVRNTLLYDIDLADFRLFIDTSGINHVLKRHGHDSNLARNGELPICIIDLMFFKSYIINFDFVEQNNDSLMLYKKQAKHINVTICEMRISNSKGRRLYLKTMYNKKRL